MKIEKKIFLEPEEGAQEAIRHLSGTSAAKVILSVPEDSALGSSVENFHMLAAAAANRKKTLHIESIDDNIVELAELAQIRAVNPLFKTSERAISDIVPVKTVKKQAKARAPERPVKKKKAEAPAPKKKEEEKEDEAEIPITTMEEPEPVRTAADNAAVLNEIFGTPREMPKVKEKRPRRRLSGIIRRPKSRKSAFVASGIVLGAILLGVWLVLFGLPQADITLTLKKTTVPLDGNVVVTSNITAPDLGGATVSVPGEVLSAKQNMQADFIANGTSSVAVKATGELTIYNAFSSAAQPLVATTRFLSPDGKIVRLDSRVTVPGATIQNGKLVPSSVTASVTADGTGDTYNLPAGTKWTIPGFKGTTKYDGFYAVNKSTLAGGASGERAVATEGDITAAKTKSAASLKDALATQMQLLMAKDLKLLDGATSFTITKQTVQSSANDPTKFTVYSEGAMQEFVFNEPMLKQALIDKAKSSLPDNVEAISYDLSYGTPQIDIGKGSMTLPVTGSAVFAAHIDTASLIASLENQDESAVRRTIFSLPGLENATVSLWPFWVHSVPASSSKVHLSIE